jgi:transposase
MNYYIGDDAHKKYSLFTVLDDTGKFILRERVEHEREGYRAFLRNLPPCSEIALETTGNYYWMIEEIEQAGHIAWLTHARKAKLMNGQINKTDKLDAEGLARLLKSGTLPTVWIPPGELRDQRELPRMRLVFVSIRTRLKNRIHATFAKYNITFEGVSDIFVGKGRRWLEDSLSELPPETRVSVQEELGLLDQVEQFIQQAEQRIAEIIKQDHAMQLLDTIPGVGPILAITIALEMGDVDRFPNREKFASYSGKVPRVISSGGRTYHGRVLPDVNRYLKWAFTEAANAIVLQQHRLGDCHVTRLYHRIYRNKGHARAITAVGRHLAEAAYQMLKYNVPYQEPKTAQPVTFIQG